MKTRKEKEESPMKSVKPDIFDKIYEAIDGIYIDTLEGVMHGEFYPVKPDIFDKIYEAIDDA